MVKFDRYILSQLLVLFGFFSLVLVAVFWINRAVALFDRLIADGQTALVFLEFTALGLPKLIATVLPLATFAASVYVTNRLNNESELVVMQATGAGPWQLVRPVAVFGMIVALMMLVLSHFLVPMAQAQLSQREGQISHNITARLLTEGAFLNPASGVTFYTGSIAEDGVLRDVFLSDLRTPDEHTIYTASQAYLVRNGADTNLIMVDGLAQRLSTQERNLSTANFKDFSFNISSLIYKDTVETFSIQRMTSLALLSDWEAIKTKTGSRFGEIAEELHARFASALFCIVAAILGFSTLLLGGFSRFGVWREVIVAFTLLVSIDGLRSTFVELVLKDASNWPMIYIPTLIGSVVCIAILSHVARPRWWAIWGRRSIT